MCFDCEAMSSGREQRRVEYKGHIMQTDLNYSIRISSFISSDMGRRCQRMAMWQKYFALNLTAKVKSKKGKNHCRKGHFIKWFYNWLRREKGTNIKFLPYKGQESLPSIQVYDILPFLALPAHNGNRLYKGGDPRILLEIRSR